MQPAVLPMESPAAVFIVVLAVAIIALWIIIYCLSNSPRPETESEKEYIAVDAPSPQKLPDIFEAATTTLSVVIPCYNESRRLCAMLEECVPFLQKEYGTKWELLLVDDGSKDDTVGVALKWAREKGIGGDNFRVCRLVKNRGKGGAVTHGMKHVRGELALFADADGASKFSDVSKLIAAIHRDKSGVAVGSRAHLVKSEAVVKRTFIRNILMYGLHTLLYLFGIRNIRDTQCGFKLFTRASARDIFPYMHTERWIFDVEALIIAMRKNIGISEVPITWHEVEGSKIDLAKDSILMAVDLVVIRFAFSLGIYRDS